MTQSLAERPTQQHKLSPWGDYVVERVTRWQRDYLRRRPEALAILAKLRRGVGKDFGATPDLWPYILEGIPSDSPQGGGPSRAELAVHTALTLFAVHQQSRRVEMHVPGPSLGVALRRLGAQASSQVAVQRRFEALGTAESFTEITYHARGLITQLRGANIALDYGFFTDDLMRLQDRRTANRVRLRWGRDFYRTMTDTNSDRTDASAGDDSEQEETEA